MTQPKAHVHTTISLEPVDYRRGTDELRTSLVQATGFAGYDIDSIMVEFEGLEAPL